MTIMTKMAITATKAKTEFAALVDIARKEPVTITRNSRAVAIMLSPEEYARLMDIEDSYWGKKAEKAEKEGYINAKESEKFLRSLT